MSVRSTIPKSSESKSGNPFLIIRTDASFCMGSGHVLRCLALGQAWKRHGGECLFVLSDPPPAIRERLLQEGMAVQILSPLPGTPADAEKTIAIAAEYNASWIAIDGYHFDAFFQKHIRSAGFNTLVVDDDGRAKEYTADIILNQNLSAHPDLYMNRNSDAALLMGTRHVLLRAEYRKWMDWNREVAAMGNNILVTMGGSDPVDITSRVVSALAAADLPELRLMVVVGPANPRREALAELARAHPETVRIFQDVREMAVLMAEADMAVMAAGTTVWETAYMALPSLLIPIAENQRAVAEHFHEHKAGINLGWHADISLPVLVEKVQSLGQSFTQRSQMAQNGRRLVDGNGCRRVLRAMLEKEIRLRPAREEDCRMVWEWVNMPAVRSASFHSAPIPWNEHVQWFNARLGNGACRYYIAETTGKGPIGQIRFDLNGDSALVSVCLDPTLHGKGYGSALISKASRELLLGTGITRLLAQIKPTNPASIRAFAGADFEAGPLLEINGQKAVSMIRQGIGTYEAMH